MGGNTITAVLKEMHRLAAVHSLAELSDEVLLQRFVADRDEGAFTVLVERYGLMVHSVCSRVLGRGPDAEDACQATFLVLVQKAGSVRKRSALSSWLHGVAYRLSSRLKRDNARRQQREQKVAPGAGSEPFDEITWREAQAILDEELNRLPLKYRSVLILCYLEGKTRDEAARQLELTEGKLHGLLQRGRDLLRKRLTHRGVALSGALLSCGLSHGAQSAPPALVVSISKAAMAYSRHGSASAAVRPQVVSLTKEALKAMMISRLKMTGGIFCACLVLACAGSGLVSKGSAQSQPDKKLSATGSRRMPLISDEQYIRRMSLDLRGIPPTPTEVHFFVRSKDPKKRQALLDLFIQARQARGLKKIDSELLQIQMKAFLEQEQKRKNKGSHKLMAAELLHSLGLYRAQRDKLQAELAKAQAEAEAAMAKARAAEARLAEAQERAAKAKAQALDLEALSRLQAEKAESARRQAEIEAKRAQELLEGLKKKEREKKEKEK